MEINMLVRLLYVSREINNEIANLAETSLDRFRESNTENDITGVLCEGEGLFLQVLEGERSNVNKLYASILRDTRHKDIELLYFEEIKERFFDGWTMEYIHIKFLYQAIKQKHPDFDPYVYPGKLSIKIVMDYLKAEDAG